MEKPIVVKNKRGKQLVGILHTPKGKKKFPLVVICHGFGGTKTDRKLIRLARALENNNIASFRFDFGGCGDSEGDFLKATVKKEVEDLDSVIHYIKKIKNINLKNISFIGHSIGALICTLFVVQNKIKNKTIVMWAPPFDQKELMKYWANIKQIKKWRRQGYLYRKGKEKIIGINYLKENEKKDYSLVLTKIKEPILIVHGKKDDVVPLKFSKQLAKEHKNIRLIVYPKADHDFEDYFIQQKLVKDTINQFKRYLLK